MQLFSYIGKFDQQIPKLTLTSLREKVDHSIFGFVSSCHVRLIQFYRQICTHITHQHQRLAYMYS